MPNYVKKTFFLALFAIYFCMEQPATCMVYYVLFFPKILDMGDSFKHKHSQLLWLALFVCTVHADSVVFVCSVHADSVVFVCSVHADIVVFVCSVHADSVVFVCSVQI